MSACVSYNKRVVQAWTCDLYSEGSCGSVMRRRAFCCHFFWPTYSFRGKIHCKSKQNSSGSPLSCDETSLSWWESLEHCTVQFGLSAFFLMYNFSPQSPKKHIQWFIFLVLLSCHQALHLLKEMDHDGDGQISESEVLKNQETFMNSEVTDYGRQLHVSTHDEL